MNFLCENCKQKYHVADEKLRGRPVTKFKCKKCEHIIEVKASDVPPPGAPGSDTAADHAGSESIPPSTGNTGTMAAFTAPKPAPTPSTAGTTAPSATASPLPTASSSAKPAFGTSAPRPAGSLPTSAPRPAGAGGGGLPTRAASSPAMGAAATASATAAKVSPIGSAKPFGSAQPATTSSPLGAAASKPAAPTNPSANNTNALRSSLNQNADNRATVSNSATTSAQTDGPRRKDSSTSALLNSSETGWYAGVRDVPVGPLTRAEMLAKIDAGDVTGETLVWREGLDDWRALQQVNELSDLLREASKKIGESVIGTGAKRSSPPNNVVPISRATSAKDMSDEFEESTQMSSLSDLIATAEGTPAAKKAPVAQPPAAQPVKTAPKVEAKPAPKAELKPEPAKPAVVETPKPKAEPAPVAKETPAPTPAPAPAPAASAPAASAATSSESDLDDDSLDNDFFKKIPAKTAPALAPAPAPAATTAVASKPAEPAKDAFVMAAPAVAAAPAAALASTPAPTISAGLASISEAPKPEKKEKEERRSGGVPMGVWVLVGGLVIAAGGGGMYAGTRINPPPPQPVVQPTQQPTQNTTAAPRLDPQVAAPININTPDPPQTPPTQTGTPPTPTQGAATTPEQHQATSTGTGTTARVHAPSTTGGHAPSTGGGSSSGGLTAEQRAEMARLLGGNGVTVGPGTGGPTIAARSTTAETAAPVQGPTGSARAAQVLETFSRTGVVRSCWQQQITRNPAHPAERLAVTLTVGSTGRATDVRVAGANDPALATCISNRARSQNFGPGGTVDAQANFNLAIGQ